jgi:GT2 family glycosyltransferase
MLISVIVPTRNRAAQLEQCVSALGGAAKPRCGLEILVVDNGSTDATKTVIQTFALTASVRVKYVECPKPGGSAARNAGIAASAGDWLVFIDDDCYVEPQYFVNFSAFIERQQQPGSIGAEIAYGSGQIHRYREEDDIRIANLYFDEICEFPKHSVLTAGSVQGANMFFKREIFDRAGGFDERLGAGTPFVCEDVEMAARASLAGYVGGQVPAFTVHHDHRRRAGSKEAEAALYAYDFGRGAYYAKLIEWGIVQGWQLWGSACGIGENCDPAWRMRLARELAGAAAYLAMANGERGLTDPVGERPGA